MTPSARGDDHDDEEGGDRRTMVGGRHGSPTVNISLPFSKLSLGGDEATADAVETLAGIVRQLAAQVAALADRADDDEVAAEATRLVAQVEAVVAQLAGED